MINIPPLSAEDARWLVIPRKAYVAGVDVDAIDDKLEAIREERHVCIERITEPQAREAFQAWWCPPDHDENPSFFSHKAFAQDAWLAAYRHAGLLIEDKQS